MPLILQIPLPVSIVTTYESYLPRRLTLMTTFAEVQDGKQLEALSDEELEVVDGGLLARF